MKKAEYIAKYGEEAWEKELARTREWKQKNRKSIKEYNKQYKFEHKEEIAIQQKKWREANKEETNEYFKKYRQTHKEQRAEYCKQWREDNPEYHKQYRETQYGKSISLLCGYRRRDKEYNRGECTLTSEWIVDNILTNTCIYCGESNWRKLGCDRINNDLPHTPDNVVCSCRKCNLKRHQQGFEVFLYKSWRLRFK